jgi:hypothetical protein
MQQIYCEWIENYRVGITLIRLSSWYAQSQV